MEDGCDRIDCFRVQSESQILRLYKERVGEAAGEPFKAGEGIIVHLER